MSQIKKPSQELYLPTSILEDPTVEPLKPIVTPYAGVTHIPPELGTGDTATLVFIELQKCFKKAGYVAEGLLANIVWGFEQCGYDPRAVASGLTRLRELGYIYYSDARGAPIHETNFDPKKPVWIRYSEKMRALFVRTLVTP